MHTTPDEWKEQISLLVRKDCAVVVEGPYDKKAVEELGVRTVFVLSKKPLFEVAEDVASTSKTCIILTDLDAEGKKLYSSLAKMLQRLGVRTDNTFRNFLFTKTDVRQIEGMKPFK